MNIDKNKLSACIVDLKNLFLLGEWYEQVLDISNKRYKGKAKYNVDFEVRSIITDLFIFGFVCLPSKWTTFSIDWLKVQLEDIKQLSKSFIDFGSDKKMSSLYQKQISLYLNMYIECRTDVDWPKFSKFAKSRISNKERKLYLNKYLKLLNSYDDENIPLWDLCKEIRLLILSELN